MPLGVFLATVTHSEACASGPGAFDGGRLFGLFLATLTHFEPCASGPSLAHSTAVRCYSPLALFSATVTHFELCSSGSGAFDGGRLF